LELQNAKTVPEAKSSTKLNSSMLCRGHVRFHVMMCSIGDEYYNQEEEEYDEGDQEYEEDDEDEDDEYTGI
jgi:hypothetical protein